MKLAGAALALLIAASSTLVRAEARFSRVALLLPACELPGLSPSELRNALALDLRDSHLSLAPPGELAPSSDVLVSFETPCDGASVLALRAEHRGERYARTIDLAELPPPQRARALSLALAELLSLFEHPAPPAGVVVDAPPVVAPPPSATPPAPPPPKQEPAKAAPTVEPAVAPAPSDRAAARPASEQRWQLGVAPELRFFQTTLLWGGRAVVRYRGFSAGGAVLTCNTAVPSGTVRTLTPHALVGYSFPLWKSDAALLEVGPRFGAGRTFMKAEASTTGRAIDAEDVYLDAAANIRYAFRFASRWSGGLSGELGYAGGPIGYADDREIVRTSGVFAAGVFELGLAL